MLSLRTDYSAAEVDVPAAPRKQGPIGRTLWRLRAHGVYLGSSLLGDDVVGRHLRIVLLRAAGAQLADGVLMGGGTYLGNPKRLTVGADSYISRGCYLDLEADVVIGSHVAIGHGTSLITTRHAIGPSELRCGEFVGEKITIGDGAWLAANVTILPGVTIGNGAVVAAGALVANDVAPNTLVAGTPARAIRTLD